MFVSCLHIFYLCIFRCLFLFSFLFLILTFPLPKRNNERFKKTPTVLRLYIIHFITTRHVLFKRRKDYEMEVYMRHCSEDFLRGLAVHRLSSMDLKSLVGNLGIESSLL